MTVIAGTGCFGQVIVHNLYAVHSRSNNISASNANSFIHQQEFGISPPIIFFTNKICNRHAYIGEINLVQMVFAIYRVYGLHFDAGSFHINQQERYAFLCFTLGRGADKAENPVGPMGLRGPYFLAIHHIVLAVALSLGFQGSEIRPRPGLGIALAPKLGTVQYSR